MSVLVLRKGSASFVSNDPSWLRLPFFCWRVRLRDFPSYPCRCGGPALLRSLVLN